MPQNADFDHYQKEIDRSGGVDHAAAHPDVASPSRQWSEDQTLHVAVAYSNPCRWRTRRHLFNDFRRHMAGLPNVKLYVGELAYGDRPFEVTNADHPLDSQFRTREELWHKENILNRVIARFSPDWQYGAYCDGDFHFTRHNVALETIHELQHYDWVQPYSTYSDLCPDHRPMRVLKSFAYRFCSGELNGPQLAQAAKHGYHGKKGRGVGTTGGTWAFRRESFDKVGGLMDRCILGSGDWHMAFGLAGEPDEHPNCRELLNCDRPYADYIKAWQTRAAHAVRKNIGFVKCHAVHYFHGSKQLRGYGERWKILRDNHYDPNRDVFADWQGLYQLNPAKTHFRDEIRRYFRSRVEDDIALREGDCHLAG